MLLGTLGASSLTGRGLFGQEKECTELVIKDKNYSEQDKELKKIINSILFFNKL